MTELMTTLTETVVFMSTLEKLVDGQLKRSKRFTRDGLTLKIRLMNSSQDQEEEIQTDGVNQTRHNKDSILGWKDSMDQEFQILDTMLTHDTQS